MWLILQQTEPDDYVIATGKTWSVRDFLDKAFAVVNMDWKDYVEFDERYLRPTEVDSLVGDATKAKNKLGWEAKTSFDELVKIMVESDLKKYNVLGQIK
jgi:GDPmannose 4,6-dehydratase